MTTTEATITMIGRLSEPDLIRVQDYIKALKRMKKSSTLKPLSEKEFLKKIDKSFADIRAGRVYTLEESREHIRKKYGL